MVDYGSVCSGIEAATVAWEPLGWKPAWFSEIEAFPSAVLEHHWPTVDNLGDMLLIPDMVELRLVDAPAVLVGGTPCQSFSLAGRRGGLADERGALTLAYIEILNRIDEVRIDNDEPECIAVWENVPGVLSSGDNAFGCFLAGLAGEDEPLQPPGKRWTNAGIVSGPQRTVAWRVLDAQFFGVAQRRRRVFVVASARDGFDPARVLFESEGLRRDIAPTRPEKPTFREIVTGEKSCWWDGGLTSQTLDAVLYKKQCLPEKNRFPVVIQEGRARFITPCEGERLQGFPNNHTLVLYRNKPASNGPRYKAIGNSMAVPVMNFIGSRIQLSVELQP